MKELAFDLIADPAKYGQFDIVSTLTKESVGRMFRAFAHGHDINGNPMSPPVFTELSFNVNIINGDYVVTSNDFGDTVIVTKTRSALDFLMQLADNVVRRNVKNHECVQKITFITN